MAGRLQQRRHLLHRHLAPAASPLAPPWRLQQPQQQSRHHTSANIRHTTATCARHRHSLPAHCASKQLQPPAMQRQQCLPAASSASPGGRYLVAMTSSRGDGTSVSLAVYCPPAAATVAAPPRTRSTRMPTGSSLCGQADGGVLCWPAGGQAQSNTRICALWCTNQPAFLPRACYSAAPNSTNHQAPRTGSPPAVWSAAGSRRGAARPPAAPPAAPRPAPPAAPAAAPAAAAPPR